MNVSGHATEIRKNRFPRVRLLFLTIALSFFPPPLFSGESAPIEELLSGADMFYWMGMAEGGDMDLFEEGLRRLDRAERAMARIPEEERSNQIARVRSLRIELEEQLEMAHDTINGTLPLFRYLIGRGALNEWVDDPWVMGAVRGAFALSETAAQHWKPLPQLDVVYSSSVHHLDNETVLEQPTPYPTLENEMAYVFNLDGRFFNHNRLEVRAALNDELWNSYLAGGMGLEHARVISSALSLDQVLEIRLHELHVKEPLWFYQLSGRLRDGETGISEGTAFAFGMVRDLRSRLPWLPLAVLLPCLLAMIAAKTLRSRITLPIAAFVSGTGLAIPLIWLLSPRLAPGEALLVAHWWAPLCLALGLLIIVPILFVLISRRVSAIEKWFFCTPGSQHATALGIAGVPAAILGVAALSCIPTTVEAISLVPLAWLSFLPLPVMLFEWAASPGAKEQFRERLLALVAALWFGAVWWLLPLDDSNFAANATLLVAIISSLVAALRAGRGALPAVLFLSAGGTFGAALTGDILLLLPWSLAGTGVLLSLVIRSRGANWPGAKSENEKESGDREKWPGSKWTYFAPPGIETAERFLRDLTRARSSASGIHLHVEGAEGSGKTRVIGELLRDERWKGSIFTISCKIAKDEIPFAFLVRGFEDAKQPVPSWLSGDNRLALFDQVAGSAAGILPGADLISGMVPEGDTEKLSPEHVASWVVSFFEERSKEIGSTCLLWIDDAGNLSGDEEGFVVALLDQSRIHGARLALITSSRAENDSGSLRLEKAVTVHLEWHDELLRNCLESTLSRECVDVMMEKTSIRVPGFFIDWAEELAERGILDRTHRGWTITSREERRDLKAPETILESAAADLAYLDEDSLDLLRVAACDGGKFHAGCVARAAGKSIEDAVRLLERCEDRGIVIDLPEDRWFQFRDELVREFLWKKTKRPGQESHRQRYAMALESLAHSYLELPDSGMAGFERLGRAAHHFKSARTDTEAAVSCRLELARVAHDRQLFAMAIEEAESLVEDLARKSSPDLLEAGVLYLRAISLVGGSPLDRGDEGKACFKRLRCLCEESGLPNARRVALSCEVARTLWHLERNSSNHENRVAARELLANIDVSGLEDAALLIRLWHYRGRTEQLLDERDPGQLRAADESLQRALRIDTPNPESKKDRAEALNSRANCLISLIDLEEEKAAHGREEVIALLDESIALKKVSGDRLGEAMSLGAKGRFFLYSEGSSREDLEEALKCFEENETISTDLGNVAGQKMMPSLRGECLFKLERFEEAITEYRRALKVASALGDLLSEGFARIGLVDALRKSAAAPDLVADERKALALVAGQRKETLGEGKSDFFLEKWEALEASFAAVAKPAE